MGVSILGDKNGLLLAIDKSCHFSQNKRVKSCCISEAIFSTEAETYSLLPVKWSSSKMIAGRVLAPIFFQNKMIEKMIVAEWSLTLVWNILTKWSLKWSLKNLDFEKISTILCMYTREIAYLHWKIGFRAVFMHVYTLNCEFTLENWFSSSFYACIHALPKHFEK